jgi:hypothetical protein
MNLPTLIPPECWLQHLTGGAARTRPVDLQLQEEVLRRVRRRLYYATQEPTRALAHQSAAAALLAVALKRGD